MHELIKIEHINFKIKYNNNFFGDINVFNLFDVIFKTSIKLSSRLNNKNHNEI
jgi:hypothetical protein